MINYSFRINERWSLLFVLSTISGCFFSDREKVNLPSELKGKPTIRIEKLCPYKNKCTIFKSMDDNTKIGIVFKAEEMPSFFISYSF